MRVRVIVTIDVPVTILALLCQLIVAIAQDILIIRCPESIIQVSSLLLGTLLLAACGQHLFLVLKNRELVVVSAVVLCVLSLLDAHEDAQSSNKKTNKGGRSVDPSLFGTRDTESRKESGNHSRSLSFICGR